MTPKTNPAPRVSMEPVSMNTPESRNRCDLLGGCSPFSPDMSGSWDTKETGDMLQYNKDIVNWRIVIVTDRQGACGMTGQPIEDHGLIGNMYTAALVGKNGSIDWYCTPQFDSPSVFASILDEDRGGHFFVRPRGSGWVSKQFYWPETNILVTRFLHKDGSVEITDFMPILPETEGSPSVHQIIRKVTCIRGRVELEMECRPAFDYGRSDHVTEIFGQEGARFDARSLSLGLATEIPLGEIEGGVGAKFPLAEGEAAVFVLRQVGPDETCGLCISPEAAESMFRETASFWRNWLSGCRYQGRWREMVHRSALVLKLLTFAPTGAIIAAPTTSLPETPGGIRNWDYRYTWIRDSAFTIYVFLRLGFTAEAKRYFSFLESICTAPIEDGSPPLQVMYGIDGRVNLAEEELAHLEGYGGAKPVRIGNGAHDQLQLDIFGELLDAAYLFNKHGEPISLRLWKDLVRIVEWVRRHWQQPDDGIWEVRGGKKKFVYSKVMCWVALDRAIRLAEKRSFPADIPAWSRTRNDIYNEIMEKGWNSEREAFTQSYGSEDLDASNLIMPLVFFVSPSDPLMRKTIEATVKSPEEGGLLSSGLVYRYNPEQTDDGLEGEEGTFNMCTFWLVEALTRSGRYDPVHLEEARLLFEKMLGFANHLGLYAEEVGKCGEALGNFPQAFTHLSLISAAFNLDRVLDHAQGKER